VPGSAGPAGAQGPAGSGALTRVVADRVSVAGLHTKTASATCPNGDVAVGGGYAMDDETRPFFFTPQVLSSYPSGTSWVVTIANTNPFHTLSIRVNATCASAG
jgi:hypothetical protein